MGANMMMAMMLGGPRVNDAINEILSAPPGTYEGEDGVKQVEKKLGLPKISPEISAAIHSTKRVDPSIVFISTGPGAITEKYYGCIMAPDKNNGESNELSYTVIGTMKYGFDTAYQAKMEAAKQYPFLPVLGEDVNTFSYPFADRAEMQLAEQAREDERMKGIRAKQAEKDARRIARLEKSMRKG
jgi:hypothetical protein